MVCYLWVHKKLLRPYICIVEDKSIDHPDLIIEKRARMNVLLVNPMEDIPVKKIDRILKAVLALYE